MRARWLTLHAVLAAQLGACLPVEDRPEPGHVELRVHTDPGSVDFATDDGWHVRYDELYASIGNVRLDRATPEAECQQYASTPYLRVIDLLGEAELLATLYARGPCDVQFQVMGPGEGPIVSEVGDEVVAAMRERTSDAYVSDQSIALRVAGRAERAGQELRFAWDFRQAFDFDPCATDPFEPGKLVVMEIRARAQALFEDANDGALRFAAFAAADLDDDRAVSLDELQSAPLSQRDDRSLGAHLYFEAVPQLFWIGDQAPCFIGRLSPKGGP
jgi:hypothetical protein